MKIVLPIVLQFGVSLLVTFSILETYRIWTRRRGFKNSTAVYETLKKQVTDAVHQSMKAELRNTESQLRERALISALTAISHNNRGTFAARQANTALTNHAAQVEKIK